MYMLQDLIIDAIYHNILQAKLDQSNHQVRTYMNTSICVSKFSKLK